MHGITRPGRAHEQLVRFTRAMAASGLMTIVPEVPEWRQLDLAPNLSSPTIKAAIAGLRTTGFARDERVGIIGFSFGAPHAIAAAGSPELRDEIAGVAGFGGYCSLESTFRFMMTGRHEWRGREHFLAPDRYGRWIVAANYLTSVPEHEDATDVAEALRELAMNAGDTGTPSWHPMYEPLIGQLRARVAEPRRQLFDLFAPTADSPADSGAAPALAEGLSAAARRVDPTIDPLGALACVSRPVHLLHGRNDHLIPFSEAHRLHAALPPKSSARLTVTRLFGHSGQEPFPFARAAFEVPRFARALTDLLALA
jgi:predicted esterase